jgi:UDP-N-acetyl-2-amino-2-deoxyglucuronate dehydrogenase
MAEARAMVDACRRHNVALAINHQRRMSGPYRTMKRLIDTAAIGRVELIRGVHAGDVLSDGTHTVDVIRHLTGDAECRWVLGQVFRDRPNPEEPRGMGFQASGGWRYGHPVETGGVALLEFVNGLRAEVHSGQAQVKGRQYQDFEVFGSQGRLWRAGDQPLFPLMLQDTTGGFRQVPVDDVHLPGNPHAILMANVFKQFAAMVRDGAAHPLSGESALKGHEIVMAIYESARTRSRIELPLKQDAFPLQIMVDEGQM